ncbi:MAG TPA: DUF4336 domain-containing protein [Abditibacteriaceae bacterium]|nr:DUF4336 domain-containing protein [Abditibacteriaceae bacterium]
MRNLAADLWVVEMPFAKMGFEMGARMTIVRLTGGQLWIHSPVELDLSLKSEVASLGEVAFIVSPYRFHYAHLAEWARAFPTAKVFSAPGLTSEMARTRLDDYLDDTPVAAWSDVLDQAVFRGNTLDNEVDFLHRPSRTLILADLCFNIPDHGSFSTKMIARSLGVLNHLAPTRTFRVATKEPNAVRASVRLLMEWDFDRIILSHGNIVERNGKARLREAFAWLFE